MDNANLFLEKAREHYKYRLLGEVSVVKPLHIALVLCLPLLLAALLVLGFLFITVTVHLSGTVQKLPGQQGSVIQLFEPVNGTIVALFTEGGVQLSHWQYCDKNQRCLVIQDLGDSANQAGRVSLVAKKRLINEII
ncbi:hypothetical protein [Gallaecimonas pentaromativorans]|uniref:hypothetical protein n=1 Tax=Gallaecimonas pentaromativorans TaxID=584787 RepID=UPI003A94AEE7